MCPKYKALFNFRSTSDGREIHDAAAQFVRKVSGTTKPSKPGREVAFARRGQFDHRYAPASCSILRKLLQPPRDPPRVCG